MLKRHIFLVLFLMLLCMTFNVPAEPFTAYGMDLDTEQTMLDLGKLEIIDFDELSQVLQKMPDLTDVFMYNTKMEETEMEALSQAFPNIRFGWTLRVAKYRVRTDVTAFSTLRQPDEKPRYNAARYAPLRFCWQIQGLDLGHNSIEDLTFLSGLTDLHYLILADNKITDLTPVTGLKNLEYVELFMNDITDIRPLTELPNLIDLNLSRTRIEDLSPLYEMKQLKRLWISRVGSPITEEEKTALTEALPNTEIHFTANCTAEGWRKHPRFQKVKNSFRLNLNQQFIPWTDEDRAL
ncbi:MAG: leucine-rich repeat domain-containing protein [Clostridia bacterium]|nr:leucine-rich repeat domain-containing protein [Clostridia bacterium]